MNIHLPMKIPIRGFMRLRVGNDKTGVRFDTGWFENIVVNNGLDNLPVQTDCLAWFHVGTGTTLPAENGTWVNNWVASTNVIRSDQNGCTTGTPFYGWRRVTRRFAAGAATGNLNEAAVGWSATTGTAFAHQLIKDGGGNQITITVKTDEWLDFSYELRYIVPIVDWMGVIPINGIDYNVKARAASCTSTYWWSQSIGKQYVIDVGLESYHRAYSGTLGPITGEPTGNGGTNTGTKTGANGTYIPGNYYRDFTLSASPAEWNVGGIRSLVLSCKGNRWQYEFAKVSDGTTIPKTSGTTMSITYRVSWMRA